MAACLITCPSGAADVRASAACCDAVPGAPGGTPVMDFGGEVTGPGTAGTPAFRIGAQASGQGFRESPIASAAPGRAAVRAFFQAAPGAGAQVLHEPGLWPGYHASCYGALARDPDGNNIEAVCHAPGSAHPARAPLPPQQPLARQVIRPPGAELVFVADRCPATPR